MSTPHEADPAGDHYPFEKRVNNWGGLGRWAFLEVTDPWDADRLIRAKFLEPAGTAA